MRTASAILERAFADLHAALRPGMSEREIHNVLAAASFTHGAHRLGYTMAVAGVERGLFGDPTERRWQKGEVLFVDGGVVVDGYWADYCRMYTVGPPTPSQRDDYARAVRALDAALALDAVPTAGSLGRAIGSALDLPPGSVGFGRFGHGIGLYMPEPPSLHPDDPTPLEDGTVLCVEPAYLGSTGNYVVEEEHVVSNGRLSRISPEAPRRSDRDLTCCRASRSILRRRSSLCLSEAALQTTQQHEQRGLRRGVGHDGAAAGEVELLGRHAVRAGEADVDQTDRLALGCAARSGDAGGRDRDVGAERRGARPRPSHGRTRR